jgi:hypothetical protein
MHKQVSLQQECAVLGSFYKQQFVGTLARDDPEFQVELGNFEQALYTLLLVLGQRNHSFNEYCFISLIVVATIVL